MASKAKTIGRTDPTQPGTAVEERERLLQSTREQENKKLEHEHTCKNIQFGGDLEVNRLGFGAMRLTGKGILG